ncbi:MAG TPA: hypothetical protein VNI82_00130 [Candidatus Nitrosotenuis sp.]|nr:hypothetical protein [Candidatus Nitrosotenuis sp.]
MKKNVTNGFAMPAVIIITTALLGISTVLLQTVISARSTVLSNYYLKLAEEAAEAGTAYASACLEKNYHAQTWGNSDSPLTKLTQNSDCSGNQAAFSGSSVVASDSRVQTRFVVGDLEYSSDSSVQISASGYTEIKSGTSTTISKTFTSVLKKTIIWNAEISTEKSVSGTQRTCGILSGSVYCWGTNLYGSLGNGTFTDSNVPVKVRRESAVLGNKPVTDLVAGGYANCALAGGEAYCWGLNSKGQLGNGTTDNSNVPVKITGFPAGLTVTKLGAASSTICAILSDKSLYCWGNGSFGALGIGPVSGLNYRTTPQKVTLPAGATAEELGTSGAFSDFVCAILPVSASKKVYCWGLNDVGQLGNGTLTTAETPTAVSIPASFAGEVPVAITTDGNTANVSHACVLTQSAKVFCWGSNESGVIGNGTTGGTTTRVPTEINRSNIPTGDVITEIAAGASHSCLIASGKVYCWGKNGNGQLGIGTSGTRDRPTAVSATSDGFLGRTVYNLAAGAIRACASAENRVFCWGAGAQGQIGDGFNLSRNVPTESIFLRPKNNQYIY